MTSTSLLRSRLGLLAGKFSALPGAVPPGDIQVGSPVILQDGYAEAGDASGPLKVGDVGTVVEISDSAVDNSNVCEYANDGECDEPDNCLKGTDTADCQPNTLSGSSRRMLNMCLVVGSTAAEACMTTHGGINTARFSTSLFVVSLCFYFQLGSPSTEALGLTKAACLSKYILTSLQAATLHIGGPPNFTR